MNAHARKFTNTESNRLQLSYKGAPLVSRFFVCIFCCCYTLLWREFSATLCTLCLFLRLIILWSNERAGIICLSVCICLTVTVCLCLCFRACVCLFSLVYASVNVALCVAHISLTYILSLKSCVHCMFVCHFQNHFIPLFGSEYIAINSTSHSFSRHRSLSSYFTSIANFSFHSSDEFTTQHKLLLLLSLLLLLVSSSPPPPLPRGFHIWAHILFTSSSSSNL